MRLLAAAVIFGASLTSHLTDTPQVTPGPTTAVKPRPRPAQAAPRRLPTSRHEHRKPLRVAKVAPAWSDLARCESGGRWHIVTPPFYGGLQETLTFWRNYGGLRFASRPDLATRRDQITVAERGLAAQGRGAWPVCSLQVGAL